MLVVISDLHFTDGTAGEHNLPPEAFRDVFLSDIAGLAERKGAKEITLLLLGDVFDLIRSEQWFSEKSENRPWGANGVADLANPQTTSLTESRCIQIMGTMPANGQKPSQPENTILYKNWETLEFFRNLEDRLNSGFKLHLPVNIIYVLGNHDRLLNVYPSLRDRAKEFLGLSNHSFSLDPSGIPWLNYEFIDHHYGIYGRHGHHCDCYNYAGGLSSYDRTCHLKVPIGDVITTEFAVKIPWQMNELRQTPKFQQVDPGVVQGLKDVDNIRPLSGILEWIYYRIKDQDRGIVREAINETLSTVVAGMLDIELVQKWRSPSTHWDEVIRAMSNPWVSWIPKGVLKSLEAEDLLPFFLGLSEGPVNPEKAVNSQSAYNDSFWKRDKDIRFVLHGHTHTPIQIPLDCDADREVIYINTGTWRNRICRTIGLDTACDFVELKQMTYTVFYRPDEDTNGKKPGTVSFELWTGTKRKLYS